MPDFFDVVSRQRACREFTPDPVPDADLVTILEAATFAPSAENRQPWVFVVVRDAEARRAVADILGRAWSGGGEAYARRRLDAALFEDVDAGIRGGIGGAPVLVIVGVDTAAIVDSSVPSSIFPAVQNLLLAADALGYGSALTTLAAAYPAELASVVGLPDHVRPVAVVPLGRPARPMGPPRRAPVRDKAHRERYGNPFG